MKKTILLTGILVLSVSFTFAQFAEKGSMLFNGSVSFYTGKEKTEFSGSGTSELTKTDIGFSPMFQYFIINNLAIGALLNGTVEGRKYDGGDKFTDTKLIFAPVVRYYIWQALFAQAHYGFGSIKSKSETANGSSETKENLSQWALVAGYSIRITDTVILDPMVGYRMDTQKNDVDAGTKTTKGQVCIQLGFTILINK